MTSKVFDITIIKDDSRTAGLIWVNLVNFISLQNVEKNLENCEEILTECNVVDYNTVLEDLSFILFKLNIEDSSALSDDSWRHILKMIEICLSKPPNILKNILDRSLLPVIGHLYVRILELLRCQRSDDIRVDAIKAIHFLIDHFDKKCERVKTFRIGLRVSYIFKMLPGLSQSLLASIICEKGRNSNLKAKSVLLLAKLINICFGKESMWSLKSLDKETLTQLELSNFNSFMTESVGHLKKLVHICLSSIFAEAVTYSASAKERLFKSVFDFSSENLKNCWDFLNLNSDAQVIRDDLIRALIIVNVEESCSTLNKATDLLSDLTRRNFPSFNPQNLLHKKLVPTSGGEVINSISLQIIIDIGKDIGSCLKGCRDENITRSQLSRICGVINFLGPNIISLFVGNRINLENFLLTLCKYLELQLDGVYLIDQMDSLSPYNIASHRVKQLFRKQFIHFRNPANLYVTLDVVRLLTSSCNNFDFLSETLLEILNSDSSLESSVLILLSACFSALSDCVDQSESERIGLALCLIERLAGRNYLQLESDVDPNCITQWPISSSTPITSVKTTPVKSREQKSLCLKSCIFMECIVSASLILRSSDDGNVHPDEMLPYIMQMFSLAAGDGLLSSTAQRALESISINWGYLKLEDFLLEVSEPIFSSLTIDFHAVLLSVPLDDSTPLSSGLVNKLQQSCRALAYFVDHTSVDVIYRLQPLLMQMLLCMDLSYQFAASSFVTVLRKVIALCTRINSTKLFSNKPHALCSLSELSKKKESMVDKLRNRRMDRTILSEVFERTLNKAVQLMASTRKQCDYILTGGKDKDTEESKKSVNDVSDCGTDTPPLRPPHLRLVEEIMLRCIHMMSNSEPRVKVSAMCLLSDGCSVITDEDILLPIVHKMWAPLLSRIQDRQPAIVEKAFELFSTLTFVAGPFIRSRVSSDLVPSLVSFLQKGALVSSGAKSSYECLTSCLVQKRLLYSLGLICVQLNMFSNVLHPVVKVMCEYLKNDQPLVLREAASHSLLKLCELDPGVVMYEVNKCESL